MTEITPAEQLNPESVTVTNAFVTVTVVIVRAVRVPTSGYEVAALIVVDVTVCAMELCNKKPMRKEIQMS